MKEQLIEQLKALGLNPVVEADAITLEYNVPNENFPEYQLHKSVLKLINKYVGFWKSIACHANHDRQNRIARFKIPFKLIGPDITDEQLIGIAGKIGKQIRVPQ